MVAIINLTTRVLKLRGQKSRSLAENKYALFYSASGIRIEKSTFVFESFRDRDKCALFYSDSGSSAAAEVIHVLVLSYPL